MTSEELPDLTDWLTIEAWTLEDAAMLWAAIDPFDHPGVRIAELGQEVPSLRRRKAMVYQRAAVEAVCGGTLPFVVAKEFDQDDNMNEWITTVSCGALPDRDKVIPHKTVVKTAAFMSWAKSKGIQSYRQRYFKLETSVVAQAPALPKPGFRDPANPRAAVELVIAFDVWEEASGDDYIDGVSPNPKQVAMKAINRHEVGKNLSAAAKNRISTLVNWKPDGGCPKTPCG